nr:MAG TPA: hypothetical protein [Caudoviricetes sp.]
MPTLVTFACSVADTVFTAPTSTFAALPFKAGTSCQVLVFLSYSYIIGIS